MTEGAGRTVIVESISLVYRRARIRGDSCVRGVAYRRLPFLVRATCRRPERRKEHERGETDSASSHGAPSSRATTYVTSRTARP